MREFGGDADEKIGDDRSDRATQEIGFSTAVSESEFIR